MTRHGMTTRRGGYLSSKRPMRGEHSATVSTAAVKPVDTSARDQPNAPASGFRKMPKVKMKSDPKPTKTPQQAVSRICHRRGPWSLCSWCFGRWLRAAGVSMDCRSFRTCAVGFIAHRMYATSVDPPVIEVEQSAYCDGVINRFITVANRVQCFDIGRLNGNRIAIHLVNESKQSLLRI